MKMKKFFIIAAAALVASAACTKVQTEDVFTDGNKISFEVASYATQTKAAGDPSTSLQAEGFETFYTYANFFQSYADPQTYMDNVAVNFTDGTPKVWAPARDYYWPKNGHINFYSYVNTKLTGTGNLSPEIAFDSAKTTATATYSDKTIGATDNILLADAALIQNGNRKDYIAISGVKEGVPTLFRHLLAKLHFTVKLATTTDKVSTTSKFVVTILNTGENLSNIVADQKGSFVATNEVGTLSTATVNPWTMPNVWTPASTPVRETINMLTPTLTLPKNTQEITAVDLLAERTVMPQTLASTNVFKLSYKVETYYDDEASPYMTEYFRVESPISTLINSITAWNKNTKVTYNIIIDPVTSKITFDPAVEEWDATSADKNLPTT